MKFTSRAYRASKPSIISAAQESSILSVNAGSGAGITPPPPPPHSLFLVVSSSKTLMWSMLVALLSFFGVPPKQAKAQMVSATAPVDLVQATTSSSVANTGYDMRTYNSNGGTCAIEAWVWDGSQASIGARLSNGSTFKQRAVTFTSLGLNNLQDPDVVIGQEGGNVMATVVGINAANRITIAHIAITCSQGSSTPELNFSIVNQCELGLAYNATSTTVGGSTIVSKSRKNYSPNIDMNSSNEIAVVWGVKEDLTYTVNVPTPPFLIGGTQAVNYSIGNVYTFHTYLGGGITPGSTPIDTVSTGCIKGPPCIDDPVFSVRAGIRINRIFGNPIGNFQEWRSVDDPQYYNPDVAIGERSIGNAAYITYAMMKSGNNGGNNLVVRQTEFASCNSESRPFREDLDCFKPVFGDKPRIAMNDIQDSENWVVVIGQGGGGCNENGYYSLGLIQAFIKNGTSPNCTPVELNSNTDIKGYFNYLPVVSYMSSSFNGGGDPNSFIVSWVATNVAGSGAQEDIITRIFDANGDPLGTTDYAFVNNTLQGVQAFPSVAARHADVNHGQFFYDLTNSQAMGRISPDLVAQTGYVSTFAPSCTVCAATDNPEDPGARSRLSVSPNPTTGTTELTLNKKGDGMVNVKVLNQLGETVLEQRPDASRKTMLNVKKLPNGTFKIVITTEKGEVIQDKLVKE